MMVTGFTLAGLRSEDGVGEWCSAGLFPTDTCMTTMCHPSLPLVILRSLKCLGSIADALEAWFYRCIRVLVARLLLWIYESGWRVSFDFVGRFSI